MKFLIYFLFSTGLFAQSHPHITTIHYLPDFQLLEWSTQEFDDNEKSLPPKADSWSINLPAATMSHGSKQRKFEKKEGEFITQRMDKFTKFIADKVVGVDEKSIVQLFYNLEDFRIDIQVQESTLVVYTYINGSLFKDNKELKKLDDETDEILFDTSMKLIRYCWESVVWWLNGKGTPTGNRI
jgi:hypothetical protein